jgi:GT2 family glycosyltransferase
MKDTMTEPIPVFIVSYERPLYLWASLDSLYRTTTHPHRFILADNCSKDPLVRDVIGGFERRGMFYALHICDDNDPNRLLHLLNEHRDVLTEYFVHVESDVTVEKSTPCWLGRFVELMTENPRLGLLGSLIDTADFIDVDSARRLSPELSPDELDAVIKAKSPERNIDTSAEEAVISPFNPPGRLAMIRTDTLEKVPIARDGRYHRNMEEHGYETGIATGVVHRHLSLLNLFDYPDYDTEHRQRFFDLLNTQRSVVGPKTS